MVRAVAFLSGVEFLEEIGLGGIGDVVVADSPEAFEGEDFSRNSLSYCPCGYSGTAPVSGCAAVHIMIHFLSFVL